MAGGVRAVNTDDFAKSPFHQPPRHVVNFQKSRRFAFKIARQSRRLARRVRVDEQHRLATRIAF